jgi:hypothetical protein
MFSPNTTPVANFGVKPASTEPAGFVIVAF